MPLESQVKILRALQERTIVPVGGEKPIRVDVRIISATHRDLEARQRAGLFREDLRYRLDVIRITLPPLRDRGDDILEIAESLLPEGRTLTDGARRALLAHSWPGNVRELRNAIEQSLFRAQGAAIQRRDLPPAIASAGSRARLETPLGTLEEVERRHIDRVLEATGGNKKQAAEILGIARETLYQKLKHREEAGGDTGRGPPA
jgi:DNA-binding NtrC family response regulator